MRLKKFAKNLAVILIAAIVISCILTPQTTAYADDLTSTLDFITSVILSDRAGNPFGPGDNVAKDAELRLTYEFAIPNTADVFDGDTFSLPIPSEIALSPGPSFDLVDSRNGGTIAVVSYVAGGLLLTFTDHAQNYSDITGNFYMELAFDESQIGNNEPYDIDFEVGGSTGTYTVQIDFDQPPPPETTVAKSGSYDPATKEITWTVVVNQEAVEVLDGVLTDSIPAGLTFVPGSVRINGSAADPADYSFSDPTLTYTFPTSFSNQQTVEFRTAVEESEFIFADSHGATVTESNSASLSHNGTTTASNSADVDIDINFIEKTGTYNGVRKQIDWTITINQIGITIPDAVVSDSLPAGLTLDTGSVEIDGSSVAVPSASVAYSDPDITFTLGAIAEEHTISFSTDVDPALYEQNGSAQYTNAAVLTGTNVPGNASDSNDGPVGVSSSVISKSGAGYDAENAEITWRITVNANTISIINPVVTDMIPLGQEYVLGSAVISGGSLSYSEGFSFDATDPDASHTGTLTYTFGTMSPSFTAGATIDQAYTIEFRTTVTDPNVYAANRTNVSYSNAATITGDNIPQSSNTGTQPVTSEVIDKSNQGYDYATREISWQIQVNQNEMDLDNVVISDTIEAGQEYVSGSFQITSVSGTQTGVFSNVAPTWTYTFDGPIAEEYIITFKTLVTDISVFETNGTKSFSNSAEITTNLVPTGVINTDSQPVNNTVIGKTGDYTTGNTFIDWTITINTNDIPLSNGIITDQLQEGLALDTSSVKLYHATVNPGDGSLVQGAEILGLTSDNVSYDIDTRLFEFAIPSPVSGGYILTFSTDVTDKSQSPFVNTASFNGSGQPNTGEEAPINVAWAGSGSSGTGDVGSMEVIKVDAEDNSILLQGAVFELEDKYGNIVKRVTSDASGSALFDRLRFDVNYIVHEVTAPTGYTLSSEDYLFQIDSALSNKNLTYQYENDRIYGIIEFSKLDEDSNPLQGAIFTLYNSDSNPIATATSDAAGLVQFTSVQYGIYTIRETSAPEGYLLSSDVLTAVITTYGETVTPNQSSVTNNHIRGNVQVLKTEEDGTTALQGATLSLFSPSDTSFSTPLYTQVSDASGIVLFEDVIYGDYVVKETAAPAGFSVSDNTIDVSVSLQGVTVDAGVYINEVTVATIEVLKRNTRYEPLAGATFTLYNSSSEAIGTATSGADGIARFNNIPYGNYTVKETNPPYMYLISYDVMVADITTESTVRVISTNERSSYYPWPDSSPNTGDGIEGFVLVFLMGFMVLIWMPYIDNRIKNRIASVNQSRRQG